MKEIEEKATEEAAEGIDWAKAKHGKDKNVRLVDMLNDIDELKDSSNILKRHDNLVLEMLDKRDRQIRNLQRWLTGITIAGFTVLLKLMTR